MSVASLRTLVAQRQPLLLACQQGGSHGGTLLALRAASLRHARHNLPINTIINFIPHQEEYVVERFGKFRKTCESGLKVLLPFVDRIAYVQSMKELAVEIPSQTAITTDNVTIHIDGVLYYKVIDAYKASYGVEDARFAISQLAQTTMRSELGRMNLDSIFQERSQLNTAIVAAINQAAGDWGIQCMRYEIRDISLPTKVKEAMQVQVEAERMKRARVLESEGIRQSKINVAEGEKQSLILSSEGQREREINLAAGQSKAIVLMAQARAESLERVAEAMLKEAGDRAASLSVAEQYVSAFKELAKTSNTLMLPSNTGDVSSMVAQAMGIYNTMNKLPPADGSSTTSSSSSSSSPSSAGAGTDSRSSSSNQGTAAAASSSQSPPAHSSSAGHASVLSESAVDRASRRLGENLTKVTKYPSVSIPRESQQSGTARSSKGRGAGDDTTDDTQMGRRFN